MFRNKKRMGQVPYSPQPYYQPQPIPMTPYNQPQGVVPNQMGVNNYDINRIHSELNEIKRQINELTKRINRVETYLGIRDGKEPNY